MEKDYSINNVRIFVTYFEGGKNSILALNPCYESKLILRLKRQMMQKQISKQMYRSVEQD